jgi:hypothetical protein
MAWLDFGGKKLLVIISFDVCSRSWRALGRKQAASNGEWLLLKNLHLVVAWVADLEKEFTNLQPRDDFRPACLFCLGKRWQFKHWPLTWTLHSKAKNQKKKKNST